MSEQSHVTPTDLVLRTGRFIPDKALRGDERIERMEAYLVSFTEELEQLLPALSRTEAPAGEEDD